MFLIYLPLLFGGDKAISLYLNEYISRLLTENITIKNILLEKSISEQQWREFLGSYDPSLNIYSNNRDSDDPSSNLVDGNYSKKIDYNLTLSKQFITGTNLSLFFNNYRYQTDSAYETLNPSYKSSVGISFTQSLLDNAFGINDRNKQTQIKKKIEMLSWQYLDTINRITHEACCMYYDLLYYYKKKKILYEHLSLNKKLLSLNQKRLKIGLSSPNEITETRSSILSCYTDITSVNKEINLIDKKLLAMMNVDVSPEQQIYIQNKDSLLLENQPVLPKISEELFLRNRNDIQAAKAEIEQLDLEIAVYKQLKLPEVTLLGSIAKNGIGSTYSNNLDYLNNENRTTWSVGLNLAVPLRLRSEKSLYEQKIIRRKQLMNTLEALKKQTFLDYISITQSMRYIQEQLKLSEKQIELSKRKMKHQEYLYKIGKSSNNDLLSLRKEYLELQLQYIENVLNYNKTIADFYLNQGTIVKQYTNVF